MTLERPYVPTSAEAEALHQVQITFGTAWRSALILNVWLAGDGGASYFDAGTCVVLGELRSNPAFRLNAVAVGASVIRPQASHTGIHRPRSTAAPLSAIERSVLGDAIDALDRIPDPHGETLA